jgi:hypothetical protein
MCHICQLDHHHNGIAVVAIAPQHLSTHLLLRQEANSSNMGKPCVLLGAAFGMAVAALTATRCGWAAGSIDASSGWGPGAPHIVVSVLGSTHGGLSALRRHTQAAPS